MSSWTTALPDWERRIVAGQSIVPCGALFPDEAKAGIETFSRLRAVDVTGGPTLGEISRPWMLQIVEAIFGAYDPDAGRRMIREIFLLISKKNGKSTDAAGIILTALLLNWRQSSEMGILAPTIEVANNAWRPARDAIRADEELSDLLHIQDHVRTITHRQTKATVQVVAAESDTVAGKKWAVTLVDELWLFGKRPNADRMLAEATGGMVSRPEGFVMYLSTQSDEPPAGVFKDKLAYARDVRDGIIKDPSFLPILYEFPPAMVASGEAREPKNWGITNPNLGASVDLTELRRIHSQADAAGEHKLRDFFAKHLNIEIGQTLRHDRWAGADYWEQRADKTITLSSLIERCEVISIGIDGGGLDDLLGLAVIGRERDTDQWLLWAHAWAHPIAIERRKSETSKYQDFQRDGDLSIIHAMPEDVAGVVSVVVQVYESGSLAMIGLDPSRIGVVKKAIVDAGIPEELMIGISQGWKLFGAMTVAERRLAEGSLTHSGSPLMAWCVGNAKVEPKGNAALITKQASGRGKIDPLMAALNAVEIMATNPEAQGEPQAFFL